MTGAWPRPIRDRQWTDEDGVHWRIRGREFNADGPELRRLLKLPDLLVLHAHGAEPRMASGQDRDALLERVARFAAGEAPAHSDFLLAEFRDGNRRAMLAVEEAC